MNLLELPREIRDVIYLHALTPSKHRNLPGERACQIERPSGATDQRLRVNSVPGASLLRTNKQVHREAVVVLYGSIKFNFIGRAGLEFLQKIGTNASLLRHIAVSHTTIGYCPRSLQYNSDQQQLGQRTRESRELIATMCTGLRTVEIKGPRADFWMEMTSAFWDYWNDTLIGFTQIDRELLSNLPNLQRAVLVLDVSAEQLRLPSFMLVQARAHELGWEVCRRDVVKVPVKGPEVRGKGRMETRVLKVEQNFSLAKELKMDESMLTVAHVRSIILDNS